MGKKFNYLNIPSHWEHYWTKYPEGYTILEALLNWVAQVDNMVDNQNQLNNTVEAYGNRLDEFIEQFDDKLQDEVTGVLSDWQNSGFLDVVIDQALQTQIDDVSTQLTQTTADLGYGVVSGGKVVKNDPTDMSVVVEEMEVHTLNGLRYDIPRTVVPISSSSTTLRRRDLIYVSDSGSIEIVEGTPSSIGEPPTLRGVPLAIVTVKEGATKIEGNQILDVRVMKKSINEIQDDIQVAKDNNAISNRASEGVISRMLDIAQGYVKNRHLFDYGARDAFYNKGGHIFKNDRGSYEMTCSTFCHLLAKGISFENSRYNGHSDNILDPNFNNDYDVYEGFVTFRWAEWAHKNGYMFKPKDDFSNLQPGDMLMIRFRKPTNQLVNRDMAYELIEHSAVFVERRKTGLMVYEQGSDDGPVLRTYTPQHLEETIEIAYVIRLPFTPVSLPINNMLIGGGERKNVDGASLIGAYKLNKPMKNHKWYTVVVKGELLTEGTYLSFHNGGNLVYSTRNDLQSETDLHTFHFTTAGNDVSSDEFRVYMVDSDGSIPESERKANIEWVVLTEGYTNSITEFIDGGKERNVSFTMSENFTGFHNIYYGDNFALLTVRVTNPETLDGTSIGDIGTVTGINVNTNMNIPCGINETLSSQPSYSQDGVAWLQPNTDGNHRLRYRRTENENLTRVDISVVLPY